MVSVRGIPDLLICSQGKFFAYELKVGKNKATELQLYTIDQIVLAGGVARIVTPANYTQVLKEDFQWNG